MFGFFRVGMANTRIFHACSFDTQTTKSYNMNSTYIPGIMQQLLAVLNSTVYSSMCPDRTRYKEKRVRRLNRATATIAQHVPSLRAQLTDAVSTRSERRRHPDAERARRAESIVSAL